MVFEKKPVNFTKFGKELSKVKTADGLYSIRHDLAGNVTPDRAAVDKMLLMVAGRAQELIPNALTHGEAGALRVIVSELLQIRPQDVQPKFTSNLGAVSQNGEYDHVGYTHDDSIYRRKGVSNGG